MKITNTAKDERHPEWTMGGNSGAIEAQESRGQEELVNNMQLPTKVRGDKATLDADGVVFGEPLTADPLFCEATLPEGWAKRPTGNSMWSELVDATGEVRATIFYKAAFYDRDAFMNVSKPTEETNEPESE